MWGEKGLSACTSSGLTQLYLGSIKGCSACPVASLPVYNGELKDSKFQAKQEPLKRSQTKTHYLRCESGLVADHKNMIFQYFSVKQLGTARF